jgi:hypothetical protein
VHHPAHLALLALLLGPFGDGDSGGGELVDRLAEFVVVADLPAQVGEPVTRAVVDGETVVPVVHPQVHRAGPVAVDELQAEDLGAELLPLLGLGRLRPQVSQSTYLHGSPLDVCCRPTGR